MSKGVYVHIPFCLGKCAYCAFNSFASTVGVPGFYLEAVAADALAEAPRWDGVEFETLYIGGGTPSLLEPSQLARLLDSLGRHYHLSGAAEITIECNPGTVNRPKLRAFKGLGITRVSIGVQSLVDAELALLGRRHSPSEALSALRAARDAGFESVSADVMIGVPRQTRKGLGRTLDGVLECADHVSGYILALEPGTGLDGLVSRGALELPDDDTVLALYEHAGDLLADRGLVRYEISNWSLPGHACLHNRIYWQRGEYVGLGAGAHSHRAGRRLARLRDPEAYASGVMRGLDVVEMSEDLTEDQKLLEDIMLGLRTAGGIDVGGLSAAYGVDVRRTRMLVSHLVAEGYISKDGSNILLSPKGIRVHEAVSESIASAMNPATA